MVDGDKPTDGGTTDVKPADDKGGAPDPKPETQTVSKVEFDRVLGDMHRFKTEAKDNASQLKTVQDQNLERDKQWETLANQRLKERDDAVAEKDRITGAYVTGQKLDAVKQAAAKLGLKPEAMSDLHMLDLKGVDIQTTSDGQVNVLGAETFAQNLKTARPHWYGVQSAPNLATGHVGAVTDPNGPVTLDAVLAAEKEMKKTGDGKAYRDLCGKYQQQKLRSA